MTGRRVPSQLIAALIGLGAILLPAAMTGSRAQENRSVTLLDQAWIVDRRDPATVIDVAANAPRPADGGQPIALPHRTRRQDGNLQGVFWYRIDLPPMATMPAAPAIFLPRLSDGGTFYLNGQPVLTIAASDELRRVRWRKARAFMLPAYALKPDGNVLLAKIVSRDFTVTFPYLLLGPEEELQAQVQTRQWIDQYGFWVTGVTAAIVGVFILCIWWFRRNEVFYLLFGLSSLLWAVRSFNFGIEIMPTSIWWWWRSFYYLVVAAASSTLAGFFLSYAGLKWRVLGVVAAVHAVIGPIAVVASNGWLHEAVYTYWMGGLFLIIIAAMARFAWWGWHNRSMEVLVIAVGVVTAIVLAANDYATVSGIAAWTRAYTLHLALVVLLLTIGAILTIRFVRALRTSEEANEVLAERLADRERELAAHYDRARQIERREASVAERQRIMQDMHDGLGAQLVSSLMMVERGNAGSADIAVLLRESLDEMRLAIDAFGDTGSDLAGALASLRHRMEPRLRAAGITVEWKMDEAFAALHPDEHAALQVLRIVQEILANVIKHSKASWLKVSFEVENGFFRVAVSDNGTGFPADRPRTGLGLSGIRKRARDLGGDTEIESSPRGTAVTVRAPIPEDAAH